MKQGWILIFLVLIWCGFSGNFTIANMILGSFISILCLFLFSHQDKKNASKIRYTLNIFALFTLLGRTLIELVKSSVIVAWEVLKPNPTSSPEVVDIELACRNDIERTLLANLISLTPGSLTIDLNEGKTHLKIHIMFSGHAEGTVDFIKKTLEPKVMKVFKYHD